MTGPLPGQPAPRRFSRLHWPVLLLIVAVGAALRFYALGALPPGLYQDEAYNGLDALAVIAGDRPLYFTANNGREPFFIYLVSASVAVLGRTPLAVRLPAAVLGVLLLPAAYALGRALFNPRVGLLAAAVTAFTFWPVALSRIGLRAGALPVVLALSLACAGAGWRQRRPGLLALGGALYGLTFYTYLAARFTPVALSVFLIFWYIAHRRRFPSARLIAAFALPAVLVLTPLALAAWHQPEILFGRAGQVSILHPDINGGDLWGTFGRNVLAALGMFVWRGDDIARHNLPGRPVFDPLLGAAFVAGAALAVWRALRGRQLAPALVLLWVGVLALPTVLAEDTPHFLRAAGILPAIFILPALALEALWQAGQGRWRQLCRAGVVAALAAGLGLTARDYFMRYAPAPTTAYLFQSAAAELAAASDVYMKEAPSRRLYLDRRFWDQFASVRFLLPEQPGLRLFAEGQPLPLDPGPEVRLVTWPYEPVRAAVGVLPAGAVIRPELGPLYRGDLEPEAYPLYASYTALADCPADICSPPPAAVFEGDWRLLAWKTHPRPGGLALDLIWQAGSQPAQDYQVFAQAFAGEALVAQADGPLGTALYPSSWWRLGDIVWETRTFTWPAGVGGANVEILVGLYDLATGVRLQRTDEHGDVVRVIAQGDEGQ